jgi:hypothetical protein
MAVLVDSAPPAAGRRRQLAAIVPMLLDLAAPVVSFVVLYLILGVPPVIALSAGALAAGLRVLYQAARTRRISAFAVLMLIVMAATIALVFITGDPRLILAKSALIPALGGTWGIITNFVGRPLILDVATPFITKGDPRLEAAWRDCWQEPAFAARLRLINLIWGVGFLVSAVLRVVIIYHVPLSVGVFAGQAPTLLDLALLIALTNVLGRPLTAALRRRAATGSSR